MDQDYLLNKWLNGELTESEMREFRQRDDYDQLMAIVEQAQAFKVSQFSEVDNFEKFKERFQQTKTTGSKQTWIKPLLRMAAVLVVGLGLFYFFYSNNTMHVETLAGEKRTIELPDASVVVVNALSELSYNSKSWEDNREVRLEGEAFFDVTKGASFDVKTATGTITVLGTEFNVKQRSGYFEVKCFEGKVRVEAGEFSEDLEAGENFRLTKNDLLLGSNLHKEPQWMNNLSSFQRVPLSEVVAEMERQYNIKVVLRDVQPNILFTGAFVHGDLDLALKAVTVPLDLQYERESNNQVSIYPSEN